MPILRIAIVGLGYVGLPLAVEFGKRYPTVGFDINTVRIQALQAGHDSTLEVDADELACSADLSFSNISYASRHYSYYRS